jgi:uncharacterized protein (TIGR00266 family)
MEHRIHGTTMPVLEVDLQPGESIVSEAGELSWMTSSIEMDTSTQKGGGGGMFGAFKRMASGGSLFMTEYKADGRPGSVAFAARLPGTILDVNVGSNNEYMVHRHGFLCGTPDVQLTIGFQQSLGAGIFGGEGFRLQRVGGNGTAWVELSGEVVTYQLAAGETLRVHPGHVGMFDHTVSFEITRIKGIKNMIFGADGIFLAALTGPGKVWLQSLTLPNLAHAIQPYLQVSEAATGAGAGAVAAGLLKGLSK